MYSDRRVTHVRLNIHPDGGVARLRVHGTVLPDPRLVDAGPFDLAALENGGAGHRREQRVLRPPAAADRAAAWPGRWARAGRPPAAATPRNDWVEVSLACEGVVTLAELDTTYFLGNAPGTASLTGIGPDGEVPLLPRTRLQPDTRHRFVLEDAPGVDRVRLDVFPDGGMARLRLWGRPTPAGRAALGRRWFDALPDVQALEVLGSVGVPPQQAGRLVGARPLGGDLPPEVARLVDGPRPDDRRIRPTTEPTAHWLALSSRASAEPACGENEAPGAEPAPRPGRSGRTRRREHHTRPGRCDPCRAGPGQRGRRSRRG